MTKITRIINSIFLMLCLISLSGGLVYFIYALNLLGVIISLILAVISFIIIQYPGLTANQPQAGAQATAHEENSRGLKNKIVGYFLPALFFLLIIACFYILISHQTTRAIISPWQIVPDYFFIAYALAGLALILNILIGGQRALILLPLFYFLTLAVALIVYRLGYGYDPFIHRATEELIDKSGLVEPKPFYYLGQYALIVIAHKLIGLPIVWLDKFLVPLTAAVILPLALWHFLNDWFSDKKINLLVILCLLCLTAPFLIMTTPQNFAYLLLLVVILYGFTCKNLRDLLIIFLLSLTALVMQPIAGLPALLFALLLTIYHSDSKKNKIWLYSLVGVVTVWLLPALFYFLDKKLSTAPASDLKAADLLKLNIPGQDNIFLNFIYLYAFNLKYILVMLIGGGLVIAWKFRAHCRILLIYLIMSASLFVSYYLTMKIPFGFLIGYERSDYPSRILLTACLFLLPIIILGIYWLMERIWIKNWLIKASWLSFLVIMLVASLYLTYPRYDNYFNSRGFSVSGSDLKAVDWINSDAGGDFIVLANQQVSAAALSRFGFKKYYQTDAGQLFYYPIPTGSPLYQYYLDMVYKKPDRDTMAKAMDSVSAGTGYFVLNKYWWAFPKILAEAKLSADAWQIIDDGEVYVFKYIK